MKHNLSLKRATPDNGLFNELRAQWDQQLREGEGAPGRTATPQNKGGWSAGIHLPPPPITQQTVWCLHSD